MLTFGEALTLLKSGQDMRLRDWPGQQFVRVGPGPSLVMHTRNPGPVVRPYTPTNADIFSNQWVTA